MRKPIISGNWKMNHTKSAADNFFELLIAAASEAFEKNEIVIFPSFTLLYSANEKVKDTNVKIGAQNCYFEEKGAFTGEISIPMIKDTGCSYVLLGHSERRHVFNETDELINKKVKSALEQKLDIFLCIGEKLEERESGNTFAVNKNQLDKSLAGVSSGEMERIVIAYEPVWAIGTGKTASPEQAQEVHAFIRAYLKERFNDEVCENTRILYGGSVKPDNVKELMSQKDIDGALVGGASLKAESFLKIIKYD